VGNRKQATAEKEVIHHMIVLPERASFVSRLARPPPANGDAGDSQEILLEGERPIFAYH
jgi:hypothetical protein